MATTMGMLAFAVVLLQTQRMADTQSVKLLLETAQSRQQMQTVNALVTKLERERDRTRALQSEPERTAAVSDAKPQTQAVPHAPAYPAPLETLDAKTADVRSERPGPESAETTPIALPAVPAETREPGAGKPEPSASAAAEPDPDIAQRAPQKLPALEQGLQIEFTDYGVYTVDRKIQRRDSSGIKEATGSNVRHAAAVRTIPAQFGATFGFRFRVIGQPHDAPIALRGVVKFPSPGMMAPASAAPMAEYECMIQTRAGESVYFSYTIEDSFELVAGAWTMEIWHGDRKLGTQTFELTN